MSSKDFKTKTLIMERPSPSKKGSYIIGLDTGYSAVKGWTRNKVFCFPSYAKKAVHKRISFSGPKKTDIYFRDESGEWEVGNLAYDTVNPSEVIDSEEELFGRKRYESEMFRVLTKVGLGIGLMPNKFGNMQDREILVQAGLPPKYLDGDTVDLKKSICGHHKFELKVGETNEWVPFEFDIDFDNVYVMPQPMGSFISASVGKNGQVLQSAEKYYSSEVIIFDPGFGTMDDYTIINGAVQGKGETFPTLGMREVFSRTCQEITATYGTEVSIPALQRLLESGEVYVIDKEHMRRNKYSFTHILEKNCKDVCRETITKMKSVHNYFETTDCIIATGGTYDAWAADFQEIFKDMSLEIIPGNVNDPALSNIFSNVRGYYYNRLIRL